MPSCTNDDAGRELKGFLTVYAAVCDEAAYPLNSEHGLSLLLVDGYDPPYVLFDAGATPRTLGLNLAMLGVALEDIGAIVLSHGHSDHTDGLTAFNVRKLTPQVFVHPQFRRKRYVMSSEGAMYMGIGSDLCIGALRLSYVESTTRILPGIWAIHPIPAVTPFERTDEPFCLDTDGVVPDNFIDEIALVAESPVGLVVLAGCCHRGIINTLEAVRAFRPTEKIAAVIGGLHLRHASEERILATGVALRDFDVGEVITGHCTGRKAYTLLSEVLGDRLDRLEAGGVWDFY